MARRHLPARNSLLLAAGLAFFAGCRLGSAVEAGFWLWLLVGLGVLLGALLHLQRRSLLPAVLVCCCALGLLRVMPALYPAMPAEGSYAITGSVYGEGRLRSDNRITFTLTDIRLDGVPVSGRAYCSVHYDDEVGPPTIFDGAQLAMTGRVYHPDGKSGEHRFDFRQWMLRSGMQFGIAVSREVTVENTPETAPVKDWAYRAKGVFRSLLTRTMGEGADLAMALLFSDREGVEEQEMEAFRRLGIAHVLSVSGLHVGVLGSVIYGLMDRLRLGKWKWFALAAFLAVYCLLTGFSASSTRAAVMLLLSNGAALFQRPRNSLNNLGAALLMVLAIWPMQAFSAGLVLSVSAVLGILLIKPALEERVKRWLPSPLLFSLAAQLGVLLPTVLYFVQLPLYGIVMNVAIVPAFSLLVPLELLALVTSPLPLVGSLVGKAVALLGDGLLWAIQLLNRLPGATVKVGRMDALWLLVAAVAMFALSQCVRAKAWKRLAAIAAAVVIAGGYTFATRPPATRLIQLAVGQADAALLFDRETTIAIDVGVDGSATLDYLTAEGRDIDVLYLTHLHIDHAGGVPYLLDSGVRIGQVVLPLHADGQRLDEEALTVLERLRQEGIPIAEMAAGEEHTYPTVTLRSHWPVAETIRTGQDANELPLVLSIEMDGYTILSASDLTGNYESYAAVDCHVLKAGHHGSADSTRDDFLDRVTPQLVLISCSSGSRSLPGEAMLERLAERGIDYLRTDEAGDVTLYVKKGQLMAAPYKGGIHR